MTTKMSFLEACSETSEYVYSLSADILRVWLRRFVTWEIEAGEIREAEKCSIRKESGR